MTGNITSAGEFALKGVTDPKIKSKKHIATDERMDWERRKDLFEYCGPWEQREIASRYQLDHTWGVAIARQWAANWRENRGRTFWLTPGRKIA